IVGLGLVNAINLTEFKAMLAHEFGHITQKSMKLSGYVYYSLGIIHDLVFGYDFFDRMLDRWRSLDHAISWPAWAFYGVLWVLRKLLAGMFMGILFLERALSRQMEFNADLMAVSVTGSDAPVHLLYNSWFGEACRQQVATAKNPQLGVPPPLPEDPHRQTQVFKREESKYESEDDERAAMWDTHPANPDREKNAKHDYIRSRFDERTAWILFD